MNQEKKRVKIAEQMPPGFLEGQRWLFQGQWIIFDPFNDLNACHEMEKVIPDEQLETYYHILCSLDVVGQDVDSYVFHATAAQRAETFGQTLKLWEAGE